MSWWDHLTLNRRMLSDIQAATWGNTRMLAEIRSKIEKMGNVMADVSSELNQVAEGLRDRLGPRLVELLQENARLTARNAELEGEDAAESAAAQSVRTEWDNLVGILEPVEDVPTPEPLPESDPAAGVPDDGSAPA